MSLRQIYNSLHAIGLVGSQRQFSRDWLHKQPSYFSSSEARSREPSLEVLLILYNRIWKLTSSFADGSEVVHHQRERLGELATEVRNMIGRRLQSIGSGGCQI